MPSHTLTPQRCMLLCLLLFLLAACTKKDIQFGNALGETYSTLAQTDTVSLQLSTYVTDSFATNGLTDMTAGAYADSLLGTTQAKAFLQLAPLTFGETLESTAVYDSLCFVVRLNGYSYGDTTQRQTVSVHELSQSLENTYGSSIYNTSSFAEMPTALGSQSLFIYPHLTDSVIVRLDDAKGQELFAKLQQSAAELQTAEAFLAYFKGITVNISSASPSAVYGFTKSDSTVFMRLYYHTSYPYPEKKWKDFAYYSNLSFNQIRTNRSQTTLASAAGEVSSERTGQRTFSQPGTGVFTKLTFPTLRNVLQVASTVKLLKATLVLNVPGQSYTAQTPLPSSLLLYQTDETNSFGLPLYNAAGDDYLTAAPTYDNLYDAATTYSFDITAYINRLLTTSGSEKAGLFILETTPGSSGKITRAVFNDQSHAKASSKLVLSLVTVKN